MVRFEGDVGSRWPAAIAVRKAFPTLEKGCIRFFLQLSWKNPHLWTSFKETHPAVIIENVQPVKVGKIPWKNHQ